MKNAPVYARRVKKLLTRLKKDGSKTSLVSFDDSMDILLLGIVCNYSSEQRAASAVNKLLSFMVDYNDLRVTPIADIVQTMGIDFPKCRTAASEISQVLNSIFNHIHDLDLNFLNSFSKKSANTVLCSLNGLLPQAKAFFKQRFLGEDIIPLDENMFTYLRNSNCIPKNMEVDEAQKFISRLFRSRDCLSFYELLKRYAMSHAPRKMKEKAPLAVTRSKAAGKKAVKKRGVKKKKKTSKAANRRGPGKQKKTGSKKTSKKTPKGKSSKRKSATAPGKAKRSKKRKKSARRR